MTGWSLWLDIDLIRRAFTIAPGPGMVFVSLARLFIKILFLKFFQKNPNPNPMIALTQDRLQLVNADHEAEVHATPNLLFFTLKLDKL